MGGEGERARRSDLCKALCNVLGKRITGRGVADSAGDEPMS